jgi:hypothetical protein
VFMVVSGFLIVVAAAIMAVLLSAHSPMFEDPDKFMAILREDVVNGTNRLADRK